MRRLQRLALCAWPALWLAMAAPAALAAAPAAGAAAPAPAASEPGSSTPGADPAAAGTAAAPDAAPTGAGQRIYERTRPLLLQVRTLLKTQDSQSSVGSGF